MITNQLKENMVQGYNGIIKDSFTVWHHSQKEDFFSRKRTTPQPPLRPITSHFCLTASPPPSNL